MKKFILSSAVIISFVIYVIFGSSRSPADMQFSLPAPIGTTLPPTNIAPVADNTNNPPPQATPVPVTLTPAPSTQPADNIPTPPVAPTPDPAGKYKNGEYLGSSVYVYYGNVQVKAIVQNGKLTDVQFLQYPNDRQTSRYISSQALPLLKQEAIQGQTANVDIISGATSTSEGFRESLANALSQA